jgi:hypothetical protein
MIMLSELLEESKSSWQHTSMKSADMVSNIAKLFNYVLNSNLRP